MVINVRKCIVWLFVLAELRKEYNQDQTLLNLRPVPVPVNLCAATVDVVIQDIRNQLHQRY
jgi:hypothetical protein